jgi:hypothetical protein
MVLSWKPAIERKIIFTLALLAALIAGCGPSPESPSPAPPESSLLQPQEGVETIPTDQFSFRSESEDGTLVEARSFTSGYRPGDEFTYFLDAHNGGDDTWDVYYCLLLLDEEGIVANLAEEEFTLQPGEGFGTMLVARYPAGIPEGAYGLALVIPDRSASITVVHLGDDQIGSGGPFPEPTCP